MTEAVQSELDRLLEVAKAQDARPDDLSRLQRISSAMAQDSVTGTLRRLLEADEHYRAYRDHGILRTVGSGRSVVSSHHLVAWAVARTVRVGATQTVRELEAHKRAKSFGATVTMALAHIVVETTFDLADGVRVIPFSGDDYRGPRPRRVNGVKVPIDPFDSTFDITAALQLDIRHPLIERPQRTEIETRDDIAREAIQRLREARYCLELAHPSFIDEIGAYITPEESVPGVPLGPHSSGYRAIDRGERITLTGGELAETRNVHDHYVKLSPEQKSLLRVPIRRLETSLIERVSTRNPDADVDSAIDLGISLESLLVGDEQGTEIGYKFALRAAHLIGRNDDSKRLEAFDAFSNLYDLRSKAVHTGKLPTKLKRPMPGHTVPSLLKVGYGFGAAAIREAIKLGMPDLDAIVLAPRPIAIVPKQPKKK